MKISMLVLIASLISFQVAAQPATPATTPDDIGINNTLSCSMKLYLKEGRNPEMPPCTVGVNSAPGTWLVASPAAGRIQTCEATAATGSFQTRIILEVLNFQLNGTITLPRRVREMSSLVFRDKSTNRVYSAFNGGFSLDPKDGSSGEINLFIPIDHPDYETIAVRCSRSGVITRG
jgi:hypothetical protein